MFDETSDESIISKSRNSRKREESSESKTNKAGSSIGQHFSAEDLSYFDEILNVEKAEFTPEPKINISKDSSLVKERVEERINIPMSEAKAEIEPDTKKINNLKTTKALNYQNAVMEALRSSNSSSLDPESNAIKQALSIGMSNFGSKLSEKGNDASIRAIKPRGHGDGMRI
jgi:hypothetical protein